MAFSRERVEELHAIISDCARLDHSVSRHTLIDVLDAQEELLAIKMHNGEKRSLISERPTDGVPAKGWWAKQLSSTKHNQK